MHTFFMLREGERERQKKALADQSSGTFIEMSAKMYTHECTEKRDP